MHVVGPSVTWDLLVRWFCVPSDCSYTGDQNELFKPVLVSSIFRCGTIDFREREGALCRSALHGWVCCRMCRSSASGNAQVICSLTSFFFLTASVRTLLRIKKKYRLWSWSMDKRKKCALLIGHRQYLIRGTTAYRTTYHVI